MSEFQKAQSARILSCFNTDEGITELTKAEILDIEKAGPGGAAFVGEIRTFGGRQYIRMPSGWKYYGKGGGAQAKAYMAEIQALKGGKKEAKPEKKMTGEEMGRKKIVSAGRAKEMSAPKEAKKPLIAMKRGDLVTILSTGQIALFDQIVREPGKEPYVLASVGRGPEIFQADDLEEAPKGAKFGDRVDAKAPVRAPSSSAVKEVMRKYSTLDPSLRASYEKVLSSVERDGSKVYDFLKELDDRSPGRVLIEPSRNNALDVTIVSRSFWSHEDGDRGDKRAEKQFAIFDEVIKKYNMKTRIEFATAAGSSGGKKHYISLAEIKKLTNA